MSIANSLVRPLMGTVEKTLARSGKRLSAGGRQLAKHAYQGDNVAFRALLVRRPKLAQEAGTKIAAGLERRLLTAQRHEVSALSASIVYGIRIDSVATREANISKWKGWHAVVTDLKASGVKLTRELKDFISRPFGG